MPVLNEARAPRIVAAMVAWFYVDVFSRFGFDKATAGGLNLNIVLWLLRNKGFDALESYGWGKR